MDSWAQVVSDSTQNGRARLTTLQLRYPRFIHAEFMTHRVFSRNASSSRAIPVSKILAGVEADPVVPVDFGRNGKGMQAHGSLDSLTQAKAREVWLEGMRHAVETARKLADLGVHKQHANRVTEPYSWINVVVTSTKFSNFFNLRDNSMAQPEIVKLAQDIRRAMAASRPKELLQDEWHLPYVTWEERQKYKLSELLAASVARCARVSYNLHDGTAPDVSKDLQLFCDLEAEGHFSPFEHQATPDTWRRGLGGNLGPDWVQYRKTLTGEWSCNA